MGLTALDILLLLLFIAFCFIAVIRGLVRQLMSLVVFYIATVAAGLFYPYAALFVTAIAGKTPTLTQAVMFWVLFLSVTIALEVMLSRGFPDTRLPKLGLIDNALAFLPGLLCAFIAVSLLLTSMGYASIRTWGHGLAYLRAGVARGYEQAALRPLMDGFLSLYLVAHRLWFPTPPPLLAYDLP
ncbi:MAG TPA: CvpA family protein [Chloroflexi bacterium]|nr:CvpA family protein [Chloroflexota bacterium]